MIYQLQQFRVAYTTHRWVRRVTSTTLLVYVIALYWFPGGFPPWAWRMLFQVIPTLPRLWTTQGTAFVLPFAILVLYSLSLLVLWGVLLFSFIKMMLHWRQERQRRQSWGSGTRQAERMAAQATRGRATIPTGGRILVAPSPAPLPAIGRTGMAPLPARNNMNEPHSSALPQSQPILLSTRYQHRGQREQAGRPLLEARPSPSLPMPPWSYELSPAMPQTGSKPGNTGMSDDDKTILAVPSFAKETVAPLQLSNAVHLRVSAASDAGRTRSHLPNEDSILAVQETRIIRTGQLPMGIFVVADGMGGHADGQQASQLVIQVMRETVLPVLRDAGADERMCAHMLYAGVQRANFTLYQRNQQRHAMMGTTMTGAVVFGTRAHIVSVGDSRTYLYRPSKGLAQVTRDHSIVAELVAAKIIAPEEIYTHPKRNEVTRCLGKEAEVEIDTFTVPLQAGDILLPCSDGLWEMVHDPEIEELVASVPRDAQHLSELLIQAALHRGGKDNVSVIVVEVAGVV